MDLNREHPEGHPDEESMSGEEEMRILEGFLEPARLKAIIEQTQQNGMSHLQSAEVASNAGQTVVSLLNQLIASNYFTAYYNTTLQIGIAKRLEHLCEQLDKIMDNGDENWDVPPEDPEDPNPPKSSA